MTARRWALAGATLAAATQTAPLLGFLPRLRPLWPWLVGQGRPDHVALTFDDGPDGASTPRFLDTLERLDVRATFFLLGQMVVRHPDLPRRMRDAGHELGVHSWDHRNHLRHTPAGTRSQLARTADLLERTTGIRPSLFRPPYGALTGAGVAAAAAEGLRPVIWSAWGRDWEERATPASVHQLVTSTLAGGGCVLLHDSDCVSEPLSWTASLHALPRLHAWCSDRGLTLGPLADHDLVDPPAVASALSRR